MEGDGSRARGEEEATRGERLKTMAATTQFYTKLNIGAAFTGQQAFNEVDRALGKTADKARRAQTGFGVAG